MSNQPINPKIENLKSQISNHFLNAQLLFLTKDAINDFQDGDPQPYRVIVEDFRSGISIISHLILEDSFVDRESFDLVYDSIETYRRFVSADYKMTERRLSILISELNDYRAEAYGY